MWAKNSVIADVIYCTRRYTKFYGTDGDAAAKLVHDAILGNHG